jgi:hypothetical protein
VARSTGEFSTALLGMIIPVSTSSTCGLHILAVPRGAVGASSQPRMPPGDQPRPARLGRAPSALLPVIKRDHFKNELGDYRRTGGPPTVFASATWRLSARDPLSGATTTGGPANALIPHDNPHCALHFRSRKDQWTRQDNNLRGHKARPPRGQKVWSAHCCLV